MGRVWISAVYGGGWMLRGAKVLTCVQMFSKKSPNFLFHLQESLFFNTKLNVFVSTPCTMLPDFPAMCHTLSIYPVHLSIVTTDRNQSGNNPVT